MSADVPPATPDQASSASMATPSPPPPPFNTPCPDVESTPSGAGTGSKRIQRVTEASLTKKLSGLNVEDTSLAEEEGVEVGHNDDGAKGRPATAENEDEDDIDIVEDDDDDVDEDEDEVDLPPEVMKRLYRLKALQSKKEVVYEQYKKERAALELKFASLYGAIYSQRAEIVAGRLNAADGTEPETESVAVSADAEKEGGVPHFWMQCMLHHEALHDVVCEGDLEALYYLSDVRCIDKEDLLGFKLEFHFDDNPFFTNAVLTKTYDTANIMDQGEPLLEGVHGTPIQWKPGRNLCQRIIRTRAKRGGKGPDNRVTTRVETTESFFKFFQDPVMYDEDDEDEDEGDPYNFNYEMDYEVALIFRNHLIPNAVMWFTGEAVEDADDGEDDEEADDDNDDDEENLAGTDEISDDDRRSQADDEAEGGTPVKALNFKAPAGFGAPPSGSTTHDGQECKQS